jgi:O-antigen/teichoic acid export membrane protein
VENVENPENLETLRGRRPVEPTPGATSDRDVVVRGLTLSSVAYPVTTGLQFAAQVLAAQMLVSDDFGTFSLAVSVATIAALVAQLGLPHSLLRRASAALIKGDNVEARHEILSALMVGTVSAAVVAALFASPLGTSVLDSVFTKTALASIATLVGLRAGLRVLEQIVPEVLRAFRDYAKVVVFDGLLMNLLLVSSLAVVWAAASGATTSLETVMIVFVAVPAVTLVPALVAIARKLRGTRGAGFALRNPVEPAMWVSTIGRMIIAQLDLILIGILGTSDEVALYAAPFRLVLLIGLPLLAVNQVVTPLIAGWYARGMRRRLEQTVRGTAGLAFLAACALALVFVVGGRFILSTLFGSFYTDAYTVLLILSIGQVLQTAAGSCGFAMMMTGHHRPYAVVLGVSTAVTVGLDVLLYDVMGIEGIALATAGMLVLQNFVLVLFVRRLAGFTTFADPRAAVREAREWVRHRRARSADPE